MMGKGRKGNVVNTTFRNACHIPTIFIEDLFKISPGTREGSAKLAERVKYPTAGGCQSVGSRSQQQLTWGSMRNAHS